MAFRRVAGCSAAAPGSLQPVFGAHAGCADHSQQAATRCCGERDRCVSVCSAKFIGSSAATRPKLRGLQGFMETHGNATMECEARGLRLCTAAELERGKCCGSGCVMDRMLTWTADPCTSSDPPPPPPPLPLPQTPRLCIMMVESRRAPSQAYWNVAQFINSEYARRHGYRFISVNSADSEIGGIKSGQTGWADRQAGLNRMLAARHWLPSCGSLLYVDSDAFVTNASLSVEAFVDRHCGAACDGAELIVPTDCGWHEMNSGIFLLRQGPLGVLSRWIEATKKETRYDFEQKTLRALYRAPHVGRAIARIPMGPDTWHFGACCKKSNRSAAPCRYTPANWITHVPTPFASQRLPLMLAEVHRQGLRLSSGARVDGSRRNSGR